MADLEVQHYKCEVCHRNLTEFDFYKTHNGERTSVCKGCLTCHLDLYDIVHVSSILKDLDYPFVMDEWIRIVEKCSDNPKRALGKYLALMKLCGWRSFTYKDTYRLNRDIHRHILQEPHSEDVVVWIYPNEEYCYDQMLDLHKCLQEVFPDNTILGIPRNCSVGYYNKDEVIQIAENILREVGQK